MSKLYSRNFKVTIKAVEKIYENRITRFNTQNSLFIFFEDIKYPELKVRRKTTAPKYMGTQNYGPCIKKLIEAGIFTVGNKDRKITYTVNKKPLFEFLKVFGPQFKYRNETIGY